MSKQLLITLVVVLGLLAVYVFAVNPKDETFEPDWEVPELTDLDRIEVSSGDLEVVAERDGDQWRLREPVDFEADDGQIDRVLELFADERLLVDGEEPASEENLSRRGFDDDTVEVAVFQDGAEALRMTIGGTQAPQSGATRTWVRPAGADTLYRLNRDLRRTLDRDLDAWWEHDILVIDRDRRDALATVDVSYTDHGFRLAREGEDWQLVEPADLAAEPDLMDRFVRGLYTLRAEELPEAVTPGEAGLEPPLHRVTVAFDDGESHELQFGSEVASENEDGQALRYVRSGNDGPVLLVRASAADSFLWRRGHLLDRDLLDLDPDVIAAVDVSDAEGATVRLERVQAPPEAAREEVDEEEPGDEMGTPEWVLVTEDDDEEPVPLDDAVVNRLIRRLAGLDARYTDLEVTPAEAGLDAPLRQLTLTLDDEDDTTHVVALGAPSGDATDAAEADHYAQVDGGPVVVVSHSTAEQLLRDIDGMRLATGDEESAEGEE